jgi:hypothetical protein
MHTEMWVNTGLLPFRVASYLVLLSAYYLISRSRSTPQPPASPPLISSSSSSSLFLLGVTWMSINDGVGPDR